MSKNLSFILLFVLMFISCFFSKKKFAKSVDDQIVIGLVASGSFDDEGYFQNFLDGVIDIKNEFGTKVIPKVITPYPSEEKMLMTASELLLEDVCELQNKGANLVWFIGASFSDSVIRFAHENFNVLYGIIDPLHYENILIPQNFVAINFRSEEGSFLAGYLASKMSKSNRIGFVTGVNMDYVERFVIGFRAGAFYANPTTRVIVKRMLDEVDKVAGKLFAEHMYVEDGVDIIFPVMGPASLGMFKAAKELGVGHYIIGVNKDQSYLAPGHVITSVIKDVGQAIHDYSANLIKNHKFAGGKVFDLGLEDNVIDIVKDPDIIDSGLIDVLIEIQTKIIKKELIVPSTEHEFDLFKARL
ncbi:BMP family ABC transporter substrate-binding protein [Borrelia recurrentis]|uniref:Basic membrane protein C lipoprotein n=1 Tax=Borrelia recurrentis (strain A1) TaxID=412418 RepID=B5RRJ1_BORRA|nr:BMP family ABC transporter substrate-binding protein [Borrelia recurrentis]ACH94625.1 basic membrane protein C; lipoprotein [Borrelia recurrentis A1]